MVFHSFLATLKMQLRDKASMALMLLFPIILVIIVGSSLEPTIGEQTLSKAQVAVVNYDDGKEIEVGYEQTEKVLMSETFFEQLDSDDVMAVLEYTTSDSLETCLKELEDGEYDAIYVLPKTYTTSVLDDDDTVIDIYISPETSNGTYIARQFLSTFVSRSNLVEYAGSDDKKVELINDVYNENFVLENLYPENYFPRAVDYYGVTILVMVCLYGSMYSIRIISRTFLNNMGDKIKSARKGTLDVYLGVLFSSFLVVFVQIAFLLLFFKVAYGVYYSDYLKMFSILFLFVLFTTLLGQLLVLLINSENAAVGVINVLIIGLSFVTNSYVILDQGNGLFEYAVNNFLPNAVAINALFSIIYNTNAVSFSYAIGFLSIYIVVFLILSLILLAKRRKVF